MRDDLSVMEMIVYDCNYGDSLSFKALQNMDDLERLKVIMSKVSVSDKGIIKVSEDAYHKLLYHSESFLSATLCVCHGEGLSLLMV